MYSIKKAFLKNFTRFTGKYLRWSLFFNFIKNTPTLFYCCVIFKNAYCEEHLRTAASELTLEIDRLELCFCAVAFKTILTQ